MNFSIQPSLENENIKLVPLQESDFQRLFAVASDPQVWSMHPNKERYKREVFQNFFTGAIESKGAFLVVDKNSNQVLGSTRFYDFDENDRNQIEERLDIIYSLKKDRKEATIDVTKIYKIVFYR